MRNLLNNSKYLEFSFGHKEKYEAYFRIRLHKTWFWVLKKLNKIFIFNTVMRVYFKRKQKVFLTKVIANILVLNIKIVLLSSKSIFIL
jgi:hypothetical protein